jgi:hypothetical protein
MGQFSVEKPVAPGSVLSGNQHLSKTIHSRRSVRLSFPSPEMAENDSRNSLSIPASRNFDSGLSFEGTRSIKRKPAKSWLALRRSAPPAL